MRHTRRPWWLLAALSLGCGESQQSANKPSYLLGLDHGGVSTAELVFLRPATPSVLPEQTVSFWAIKGSARTLSVAYATNEPFMEFEVGANSLLLRPDGSAFQPGDSILITLQINTSNGIVLDFQPSGLRFNPMSPARLTVSYEHADPDIDRDGDVDGQDAVLEASLSIWRQEFPGLPWLPQVTVRLNAATLTTAVESFTGFATASN